MQKHKRELVKKRVSITNADEEVITVVRQFPIVLRKPLIFGLFILLLAEIPWAIAYGTSANWLNISYIWMAICIVLLLIYWLRCWVGWHYSVYILTNQRIMVVKQNGFFTREVMDLALHNIQNVNYSIKGLQGAMFGYGKLDIDTLSGSGSLQLEYVHKPAKLQKQIMDEVYKTTKNTNDE
jgi:uncharacterized membrane protein YdbT with pleckstrin-like domain